MTNEAISAILDHFYNEARNAAQASFAIKELLRDVPMDSTRRALTSAGTVSADQLLRSIDDVRDLLSRAPEPRPTTEEFNLALCVSEIIEVLNMASGKRVKQMVLEPPPPHLLVTQDRRAVEQMLTRVLDTALKLAEANETPLRLRIAGRGHRVRLALTTRESSLALRIANWLNANPERALLEERDDIPFGVAVMVAGKRLRAMGGTADLARDSDGYSTIALDLPSQAEGAGSMNHEDWSQKGRLDGLNVLVAEDSDESFALTEMALQDERVWRARDGEEAMRMIQKQRFDVVFMDVHMPGMDGYEAIRSMRHWETQTGSARTPLVVLSSDDVETQQRSAAEFGCSGFLRKPLRRWDLMPLLERLK
jgi:CheY-like chemotaxis protein